MNTPVREGETIEGSRTMRNRPYPVLKCSSEAADCTPSAPSAPTSCEVTDCTPSAPNAGGPASTPFCFFFLAFDGYRAASPAFLPLSLLFGMAKENRANRRDALASRCAPTGLRRKYPQPVYGPPPPPPSPRDLQCWSEGPTCGVGSGLRSAPGTASVYKMRLRADPHRSQITACVRRTK